MNLKKIKEKFESEFGDFYSSKEELISQFWMLSESVFEISRIEFALNPNFSPDDFRIETFEKYCERLKNHEPIQYITGKAYFYGENFIVDENVLIPRPETEELIQWIFDDNLKENANILDIATGSGCIAISIKNEHNSANVEAIDISEKALEIALKNNSIVDNTVKFHKADALNLLTDNYFKSKKWDVIVSNPPYVKENEKPEIKKNVLDFEPHLALFVEDNDPLIFYREIMKYALSNLVDGGKLYFEINQYLKSEMENLAKDLGFTEFYFKKDFRGNWRMMKLVKSN